MIILALTTLAVEFGFTRVPKSVLIRYFVVSLRVFWCLKPGPTAAFSGTVPVHQFYNDFHPGKRNPEMPEVYCECDVMYDQPPPPQRE